MKENDWSHSILLKAKIYTLCPCPFRLTLQCLIICQWFYMEKSKDAIIEYVLKDTKRWNFIQDCTKDLHSITSQIYTHKHEVRPLKFSINLRQKGLKS